MNLKNLKNGDSISKMLNVSNGKVEIKKMAWTIDWMFWWLSMLNYSIDYHSTMFHGLKSAAPSDSHCMVYVFDTF